MDEDKKQTMYDMLKGAFKRGDIKLPDKGTFITEYSGWYETERRKRKNTDVLWGMDVIVDKSMPPDQIAFVQYTPSKQVVGRIVNLAPPDEMYDEFQRSFNKQLEQMIYNAFRVPDEYFRDAPLWKRLENESLETWAARLFKSGYFEDPDIRWEYQKAVYKAPFNFALRIWAKARGSIE